MIDARPKGRRDVPDPKRDPDERVSLPEDAEATLRAILAVDPDDVEDDSDQNGEQGA